MTRCVGKLGRIAFGADVIERGLVNLSECSAGLNECERFLLSIQDDLVDLALPRGELPAHGIGPGDVSRITAVFSAYIDDDEIACLHLAGARVVVKNGGIWARANDRRKRRPLSSTSSKLILDGRFHFVFPGSRSDGACRSFLPAQGDLDGLFHQCQFCRGLPHAKTRR